MIETTIGFKEDDLKKIKERLTGLENKMPSVLARVLNRVAANIKTNMAEEATTRYNVKKRDAAKTIKVHSVTKGNLNGYVMSKGSPIALVKFNVSPNRKVTYSKGKPSPPFYKVSVEKGPASKPLYVDPKAFIAVMKNGHKGVFRRTGRWDGTTRNERRTRAWNSKIRNRTHNHHDEIIEQLYGPSVPQMIKNDKSMKHIQAEAKSTMQKRIDAEIENILRKG